MGPGIDPETIRSRSPKLIATFIAIQMSSWIGCSIMLLTVAFSRKIQRHAIWINACWAWIVFGVSYSLLFLTGQWQVQQNDRPQFSVSLAQASLIYASPTLTAGTTLALALHVLFGVRSWAIRGPGPTAQFARIRSIMLVIVPYIIFIAVLIRVLIIGIREPTTVVRVQSGMYCGMGTPSSGRFSASFVIVAMIATISTSVVIVRTVSPGWRTHWRNNRDAFSMIIRILCFTFFSTVAIGISFIYLCYPDHSSVPNIILALHPMAFLLIFGSQKDLLHSWAFWKWETPLVSSAKALGAPVAEDKSARHSTREGSEV